MNFKQFAIFEVERIQNYPHEHVSNRSKALSQLSFPKLMDSAALNPRLNPEWYAFCKEIINCPGFWRTLGNIKLKKNWKKLQNNKK